MPKFSSSPEDLKKLSGEIRRLYNESDKQAQEIKSCVEELPNGWEGDSSITYINQYNALNVLISNAIDSFEEICQALDRLAISIEEGEKEGWQE